MKFANWGNRNVDQKAFFIAINQVGTLSLRTYGMTVTWKTKVELNETGGHIGPPA
jgi:hypothetical protein